MTKITFPNYSVPDFSNINFSSSNLIKAIVILEYLRKRQIFVARGNVLGMKSFQGLVECLLGL